jgi:hypothetical protein
MARCPLHPEVETRLQCAKHGTLVCPRCLACRDPDLYCRHRSACLIWFMQRERRKEEDAES